MAQASVFSLIQIPSNVLATSYKACYAGPSEEHDSKKCKKYPFLIQKEMGSILCAPRAQRQAIRSISLETP